MRYILPLVLLMLLAYTIQESAVASEQRGGLDAKFLEASLLKQEGRLEEAAVILEQIKASAEDGYLHLKLAEIYREMDRPESARAVLKEALKKFRNPDITFALAQLELYTFEDYGMAEMLLKDALEKERKTEYLYALADTYKLLNDTSSMITVLDEIIEVEPSGRLYYERATAYFKLGFDKKGVEDLERSFDQDQNISAVAALADYYLKEENVEKAIKYLSILAEEKPNLLLPEIRLAEMYRKSEDREKALEIFNKVLPKVDGKERLYVLNQIATLHYSMDNYEKAHETFMELIEADPDKIKTYYSAGITAEMMEDFESAEDVYQRALDIRSDYPEVRKRLAFVLMRQEKYKEGLKVIVEIDETYRDVDFYRISGSLHRKMENLDEAYLILREGYENNPASVEIALDLATVLEKQERYDECFEVLKNSLELNPDSPSLMNFLGYMYADLNINLDESYTLIEKALSMEPDNPAYLDSMAWVLYRMEKYEEAYGYQLRALKGAPDEEEIREHMEAILERVDADKTLDEILDEL
ncbi:tetratricopeptide repeat protein [Limisalsivibrio acetivorans]|uniref:tetratricopeptide repeat protein n=1 Tax=Limisalsivibrio acetivorans TaxID=1304888 RepID=UPI0003B44EFD|nr:tetratricopeptide repeat protein [Limisalsivibrio acetivorans]